MGLKTAEDTEPQSNLAAYMEIGERGGTEALALVATVMEHSARERDFLQQGVNEYNLGEAAALGHEVLALFRELYELNDKLDSRRLDWLLSDTSIMYHRAKTLSELKPIDQLRHRM